ncbi:hypothetical protein J7L05_01070 [bacterium]|nr:hypothetical protein [bacterium]
MALKRIMGEMLTRPVIGGFYLYLTLLWLLNIADVIQTLMLSHGGNLKHEVNLYMNVFLEKDWRFFIIAKVVPMLLVTVMVTRGYFDKRGTTVAGHEYSHEDVKKAIVFLLAAGVVYYLIVVLFPFITILISLAIQT